MDSEKNSTLPAENAPGAPPAKTVIAPSDTQDGRAAATLPGTETNSSVSPAVKEVPSGTTPAARVAEGAAKSSSTPTAAVAKGVPKAAATKPAAGAVVSASNVDTPVNKTRRRIVWAAVAGFLATSFLMFLRFFLPRTIFEPSNVFRVGLPGDYGLGVDTKWQQQYRIWVVKTSDRIFVINAVCTHLGCTPDWKASENKFKCPCHGSGYDSEGINFEGPAPRPMDRAHVELDAEGFIVVNKDRLYTWPKGEVSQFDKEETYIPL
ncbi:MAG: ubiquinol-cytochrome c reductase iron-sulfur subunit [Pyrinomonadaceae bacterium]